MKKFNAQTNFWNQLDITYLIGFLIALKGRLNRVCEIYRI